MNSVLQKLYRIFDPDTIADWIAHVIPNLILAILVFAVFYLLHRIAQALMRRLVIRIGLERTAAGFMMLALKYGMLLFGLIVALQSAGVNVTSLIAGLGIVGLSLGLAARDTLANIVAGVFLFWDRPFVIGDLIEAGGEYGEVCEIKLRTTRILTTDGKMVSMPNSMIANGKIVSYTISPHLRLDMEVTIGVNEDIDRAREILLNIVNGDSRFLTQPAPQVVVTRLGDYFVAVQLRVWLDDAKTHARVRLELREQMKTALDEAKIVMPYQTIEVISQSVSPQALDQAAAVSLHNSDSTDSAT